MNSWLIRRFIYPLHERLRGRSTYRFLNSFRETERLPLESIREVQNTSLVKLAVHAGTNVPWWRAFFRDSELNPETIVDRESLSQLPTMDKAFIREHLEDLVAENWRDRVFKLETGGSSGVPLVFYTDKERESSQLAAKARAREWWDIHFGDRQIDLWGSPIELGANDRMRLMKDRLLNFRLLSAFELSDEKMADYRSVLEEHKCEFIYGYASVLARYAGFLKDKGENLKSLKMKAVISTAELLVPEDRTLIEEIFGCPVVNEYGCRDGGYIAQSCPEGNMHIAADTVIVEILDDDGKPVKPGEVGEITVTNLHSFGMPLIRYRLGDRAALSPDSCPCGRSLPLLSELFGRSTDTLITPSGNRIHGLGAMYILRVLPEVANFQVIQGSVDHLQVLVVATNGANLDPLSETIRTGFDQLLGPGVETSVEFVEAIPVLASGKMRSVWNKMN
ncbi:MAG: phenylacetate-CoA ligase [Planctomycetota bacterium]|jgi:phenylacetate-CoA ligase